MPQTGRIVLTIRDYSILESRLHRGAEGFDALDGMLRAKLRAAKVVSADEIEPDFVTLNSRVRFRVDHRPAEERTLVGDPDHQVRGFTLHIWTARAIAMIGMQAGSSVAIPRVDGSRQILHVEAVLYQPEAAARRLPGLRPRHPAAPEAPEGASITLLSAHRLRRVEGQFNGGDDDGPGAA